MRMGEENIKSTSPKYTGITGNEVKVIGKVYR